MVAFWWFDKNEYQKRIGIYLSKYNSPGALKDDQKISTKTTMESKSKNKYKDILKERSTL